jgi:hypothetical protein
MRTNSKPFMREVLSSILRGDVTQWPFASAEAEPLFLDTASRHGVQTLIAFSLRKAGALKMWPASVREALDREAIQSAIVSQLLNDEASRVLEALARAGARPLLMKGAGLAHTHYAVPSLRPRSDTDLFMRGDEITIGRRVLQELGYVQAAQISGQLLTGQCAYVKDDCHGVRHAYDIHWAAANPRLFAELLTVDECESQAVRVAALGDHAWSLGAVHALLLACVHRVAHHNDTGMLLWIHDIHLLASRLNQDQADEFGTLAAKKGVKSLCARGLALANLCFATRAPGSLLGALNTGESEPSAAYLGGRMRNVDVLLSDLHTLPDGRRRLQLLREHVFPPAKYMLQRYGLADRRLLPGFLPVLLPFLYADRVIRGMPRWFRPLERGHYE